MRTVKDRVLLGMVSGMAGNVIKTAVDEISLRMKFSQRSFRLTAAGAWVGKKEEAENLQGQVLGSLFDFGMAGLGGIAITALLTKTGRDQLASKGIISGITIGSFITLALSVLPSNKVAPKDAASNLSYMLSHASYGLVTAAVAAKLGDPTLFNADPRNTSSMTFPHTRSLLSETPRVEAPQVRGGKLIEY